jgi:hypothetical protein
MLTSSSGSASFLLTALTASLLLTLAFPGDAGAQGTRAELIASEQADKATRLSPEEPGFGEQFVMRVLSSPLLTATGGVYPWFGTVYNGAGLAAGAGYLHRQPHKGGASATAAISINGSMLAEADWRIPIPEWTRIRPRLNARWLDAKQVAFYSVGSRTGIDDKTPFDYEPLRAQASLEASPVGWLHLSTSIGYLETSASADLQGRPATAFAGLGDTLRFLTAGAGASIDWRTSPGYSTSGGLARVDWNRHEARESAPYTFDNVEFEAVQLVPALREQYVFAFRVLATTTHAGQGSAVPFPMLPSLGGGDTVRGFLNRRFADRSRAVATAEYRWRPSRYLDMAVFLDSGTVAPRLRDLGDERLATSWGIGARLHGPTFTALRVEAARGREGWTFVFASGQPF